MDPDQVLLDLRNALYRLRQAEEQESSSDQLYAGHDLADGFEAMDEWMSKGGFLPFGWRQGRK